MVDVEKTLLTLDDLMEPENERVEIINGEVRGKMTAGVEHHMVTRNIFRYLDAYCTIHGTGEVFFDGLHYLMYSEATGLQDSLLPDTSFVKKESIPKDWKTKKPYPGVPDLAVEVISPGEKAADIQRKVRTYLDKGTEQVWVVYPDTKEVHQFIKGEPETVNVYTGSKKLDVAALFPGLELTTDQIFALPDWAGGGTEDA